MTSVKASSMPGRYEWRAWRVFDDCSTDDTRGQVREWAGNNPDIQVELVKSAERQGKIGAVNRCHERLTNEGRPDDVAVFLDADATLEPQTLTELLSQFDDPQVAAATGLSMPNRRSFGSRSSAFQIKLAGNYALAQGPTAIRIEGRFFAYRVGALADFHYAPGLIVDDTQLVDFLRERNLKVRSAFGAIVRITPAANYSDFYKQTYRAFRAAALAGPKFPTRLSELTPLTRRALIQTIREDPFGAVAYCSARIFAMILHRIRPLTFTDQYPTSQSTKV